MTAQRVPSSSAATPSDSAGTRINSDVIEDIHGHLLHVNPADRVIARALRLYKVWEPLETDLVKHEIQKGEVVLDIGANIGYYTILFSDLVGPTGRVFAFEPEGTNFSLLTANVALNGCKNVSATKKAAGDITGGLDLFLSEQNMGNHRIYDAGDGRASVRIDVVRLDDHFRHYGGRVDFIKLDIEGAEGAALHGMEALLARNPGIRLVTEFWPGGLGRCGTEPREFLDLLCSYGFELYRVVEWESRLEPTSPAELLERYEAAAVGGPELYTNLLCARPGHLNIDPRRWMGRSQWVDRVYAMTADVVALVPPDEPIVLMNEDQWWISEVVPGRRSIPFPERDGYYWGPPPDDVAAIREVERLRADGARFLAVAWPAFWWLEYYADFHRHLRSAYRCLLENDRAVVFDLGHTPGGERTSRCQESRVAP